jgi:hypothetical protein
VGDLDAALDQLDRAISSRDPARTPDGGAAATVCVATRDSMSGPARMGVPQLS